MKYLIALFLALGLTLLPATAQPVTVQHDTAALMLDPALRRPFLFVREMINQKWPVGRFFILLLLTAGLTKLIIPGLVGGSLRRIRQKFFAAVACALLYSTILFSAARVAFHTTGFEPLALLCLALVQGGFVVGLGLGANLFATILQLKFIGARQLSTVKNNLLYIVCLLAVVALLTLISTVPEIWRFPRIGNRVVILVAMIGLGGLICHFRLRFKGEE